jgi:hypothetical protein
MIVTSENGVTSDASIQSRLNFLQGRMSLFDTRIYRRLDMTLGNKSYENMFYPHFDYGSWVMDFYPSPTAIQNNAEDASGAQKQTLLEYKEYVQGFITKHKNEYLAARSFIHPYALVRLAGASGSYKATSGGFTYDRYNYRKFYEIDGDDEFTGNYSKTPTTTALINWGNESPKNKTPYCFQDFVFCKWWNKIENNRLITLRRYAAPVTDNIEFADYDIEEATDEEGSFEAKSDNGGVTKYKGSESTKPWMPLATAVTYFGEETGNSLSDILQFSAQYNWKAIGDDNKSPHDISSSQNDEGSGLIGDEYDTLTGGLGPLARFMGFLGEVQNGRTINLDGAAAKSNTIPDPYTNGPYENRILGPVNVVMNTYKRDRGLKFKHDGLNIKFSYVSRPISGINNKAVILDLLSNMLLLTYSSGTWFGGMLRYRTSKPAIYPFKYGDAMNKLYRGEIFGKHGAVASLTKCAFSDGKSYLSTFLPDAATMIKGLFDGAVNAIKALITGDPAKKEAAAASMDEALSTGTAKAIQKVIAAKAIKGATVPFITNQRALLTGEPVGDWHLTIGNPLNPIAMIGNLIVKDVKIKFSDELGPDDFPIGFEATVSLDHGLGRDRDAIESMFNRGFGRIYTLSSEFRSSADGETKVDNATGGVNTEKGRTQYEETRNTYFGGGTAFIAKTQQSALKNSGSIYNGYTLGMKSLSPTSASNTQTIVKYQVNPWQMGYTL